MVQLNRRLSLGGLFTLMLVFFAGCGDDPVEPEDPKLTGMWKGQVEFQGQSATFTFNLSEKDDGAVTGTVTYEIAGITGSGTVTGTHTYPDVDLRIRITFLGRTGAGSYKAKLTTKDKMDGNFRSDDGELAGPLSMERSSG